MLNKKQQMIEATLEEPSLIFKLIKDNEFEVIEKMIEKNLVDVNLEDSVGNDVVTRLLKVKEYDLVIPLMKKRNWKVNHQNSEGNTFGHILALDNSINTIRIVNELVKKTKFLPNIKNNKGETILDKAINNNYLCAAFKILEDKRFTSIDVFSFKNLVDASIKNVYYGKYSKLNNLEVIVDNLEKKELSSTMTDLINNISENIDTIKRDIINNDSRILDELINSHLG